MLGVLTVVAMIAVTTLMASAVLICLLYLIRSAGPPDEPGPDADDRGGGNIRRPDPSSPKGGGDPLWWPEFEREFASYVASQSVAETGAAARPAELRAKRPRACVSSCAPRPRTGDRRPMRGRRRRRRGCTGAGV